MINALITLKEFGKGIEVIILASPGIRRLPMP
jgi:hypothetical protein